MPEYLNRILRATNATNAQSDLLTELKAVVRMILISTAPRYYSNSCIIVRCNLKGLTMWWRRKSARMIPVWPSLQCVAKLTNSSRVPNVTVGLAHLLWGIDEWVGEVQTAVTEDNSVTVTRSMTGGIWQSVVRIYECRERIKVIYTQGPRRRGAHGTNSGPCGYRSATTGTFNRTWQHIGG